MKFAQLFFRFLCLVLAIFQFGVLLNNSILDFESLENIKIQFTDSDSGESDTEYSEEEIMYLTFYPQNVYLNLEIDLSSAKKNINFLIPSKKIISETQSVLYSPPELSV